MDMEYTKTVQTKHWNHLSESLLDRLKNGKHTDCTFIIGKTKTEFKLNRFILSLISPVFEAMLYGRMRESENDSKVIIEDADCDSFECIINFSYGNDPKITLNNVTSLLSLCDKYQILELLTISNEFFHKSLNAKNFCVLFNESIKIKSQFCINLCIDFLKESYLKFNTLAHSQIVKSAFILNETAMKVLLNSDFLLVKEEEIYEGYIKWLQHHYKEHHYKEEYESKYDHPSSYRHCIKQNQFEIEPRSLDESDERSPSKCARNLLVISSYNQSPKKLINTICDKSEINYCDQNELYKFIRFGLMDKQYFVKQVIPKKILSDSDSLTILSYMVCPDEGCGDFNLTERGKDIWSKEHGEDMEIDDDKILRHKGTDRLSQSAFLAMEFEGEGIHKWKFKIINLKQDIGDGSDWTSCIGIYKLPSKDGNGNMRNHRDLPKDNHFIWEKKMMTGYGFCAHSGKLKVYDDINNYCVSSDYGIECKNGDIIEMIVDMNKLEMKYIINGIDYGLAFDIQCAKYRAAVNLDIPFDAVQLL